MTLETHLGAEHNYLAVSLLESNKNTWWFWVSEKNWELSNSFLRGAGNNCSPWWGSYASAAHGGPWRSRDPPAAWEEPHIAEGRRDSRRLWSHGKPTLKYTCRQDLQPHEPLWTWRAVCSWRTAPGRRDQYGSSSLRTTASGNNSHLRSSWRTVLNGRDPLLEQGMSITRSER